MAEIAAFLGVTGRQAMILIADEGMPVFKVGETVCAKPSALRTWIAERQAAGF